MLFGPVDGAAEFIGRGRAMKPEFVFRNGIARTSGFDVDGHLAAFHLHDRTIAATRRTVPGAHDVMISTD